MLKKISIGSAILFLVCTLVSIALLPFVIDDVGKMVSQYESTHSGYVHFYEKDATGITTIYLSDYYEDLEISESTDGMIHAYYREAIPYQVSYAEMQDNQGELTLDRRFTQGTGNNFSREYMVESVLYSLSPLRQSYRLEVPKGVAVKVRDYYRLENPQELDVSLYEPQPTPEELAIEQAAALTREQAREYYSDTVSIKAELNRILGEYRQGTITQEEWEQRTEDQLYKYETLLEKLFSVTESLQDKDYSSAVRKLRYDLQEEMIEIQQDELEKKFRQGEIGKEYYYQQDLELEQKKEEAEQMQESYDYADDILDMAESIYGYDYSID